MVKFIFSFLGLLCISGQALSAGDSGRLDALHGRYGQTFDDGSYRDVCIAPDGKSAMWFFTKCAECKELHSKREPVKYSQDGSLTIGKTKFSIEQNSSGRWLFHPSLGDFGYGKSSFSSHDKAVRESCSPH